MSSRRTGFLSATDPLDDYFLVCVHLSFINYFDEYLYPYSSKEAAGAYQGGVH
jgi:hypothetical protein